LGASFDIKRSGSLGMQLLSDLSEQIDARIEVKTNGGTEVRLVVPTLDEEEGT
jgi:two-component sensor histidine kinase